MSAKSDMHTETESEDGGVALLMGESSDDMDTDNESAPTSASQSPIELAASSSSAAEIAPQSLAEAAITFHSSQAQSVGGIASGASLALLSSPWTSQDHIPQTLHTDPVGSSDDSFAQALSAELVNVPPNPSYPQHEDVISPADESLDTPYVLSTSTPTQPQSSEVHGGTAALGANAGGLWQASNLHAPYHHTITVSDLQDPFAGNSSPTLTDVFGSESFTQSTGQVQAQGSLELGSPDGEEGYAEFWDAMQESVRNLECDGFFSYWKQMYAIGKWDLPPISELAMTLEKVQRRDKILAEDLDPQNLDLPDFQGIHWSRFQTTKEVAREVRRRTYTNHVNEVDIPTYYTSSLVSNPGAFGSRFYKMKFSNETMPSTDRHFDFRETNMKFKSYVSHFQLRHSLSASSKNALFHTLKPEIGFDYGAYVPLDKYIDAKISCFNPETSTSECVMDFSKRVDINSSRLFRPSTLNAGNGVLVVGSFEGTYAMKSLSATFEAKPTMGVVTESGPEGSTNHIQNYPDRRSGLPQVAISSNDRTIRILDCTTNKFVGVQHYPYAVNCSTISPDGRLRLLVGDDCLPIVANAETGEEITRLQGHTNFGFACDWAQDGVTMATGHQDGFVRVWDARNLSQSTHSIPMEMAGSRTLQFSPVGSGKRVLVIAEPGDFVHIVDAQTFQSKQVIEFFGDISGISMPPDGSSLYIANNDPRYGGLMEFERSWGSSVRDFQPPRKRPARGIDEEYWTAMKGISSLVDSENRRDGMERPNLAERWLGFNTWRSPTFDWLPDEDLDDDPRVVRSRAHRNRHGLGPRDLTV